MCRRCQTHFTSRLQLAPFSSSSRISAPPPVNRQSNQRSPPQRQPQQSSKAPEITQEIRNLAQNASNEAATRPQVGVSPDEPFHLTVYSHKHNTHIVFTEPSRDVIMSYSAGNIGLRKGQRKTFDAAYNLAAYTFRKMAEKNWKIGGKKSPQPPMMLNDQSVKTRGIEVVLRGYGQGREAFQKALLGSEGRLVKGLVKRVTDNTRLKFGGTRSRAVRRLG